MKEKYCKTCEFFKYCEKEEWINEFTPQRSIFNCLKGYDEQFDEKEDNR